MSKPAPPRRVARKKTRAPRPQAKAATLGIAMIAAFAYCRRYAAALRRLGD